MNLPTHTVPFARLVDLVEGRLQPEERAATESHVGACRRCAEQVARLERTLGLMRADAGEDAPRDVVSYAVSLFGSRRRAAAPTPSLVGRIVASLTFDSRHAAPAFGVRSGQPSSSRQLVFTAGDTDIDLRIAESAEGWTLSGQVLGECTGGRVEIESVGGEGRRAEAELNDICEFAFPPVPAGRYKLLLHMSGADIQVSEIDLTA